MKTIIAYFLSVIISTCLFSGCAIQKKSAGNLRLIDYNGYVITHMKRDYYNPNSDLRLSDQFHEDYSILCKDFQDLETYLSDPVKLMSFSADELSTQIENQHYQIFSSLDMKDFDYRLDTLVTSANAVVNTLNFSNTLSSQIDKKIDEIYYIKKVSFKGIRGDKIIESGLFANSRSHNLKKIIIYDPRSFKVFSDYYLLKVN